MFWDKKKGWGPEADLDEPTHASDELHAKTLALFGCALES